MTPLVGHTIEECGVAVRGTDDPRRARTEALRTLMGRWLDNLYPTYPQEYPDDYLETALHYARRLRDIPPDMGRLFRWAPCSPRSCWDGGGHKGHLIAASRRGPGAWLGVYWWEVY